MWTGKYPVKLINTKLNDHLGRSFRFVLISMAHTETLFEFQILCLTEVVQWLQFCLRHFRAFWLHLPPSGAAIRDRYFKDQMTISCTKHYFALINYSYLLLYCAVLSNRFSCVILETQFSPHYRLHNVTKSEFPAYHCYNVEHIWMIMDHFFRVTDVISKSLSCRYAGESVVRFLTCSQHIQVSLSKMLNLKLSPKAEPMNKYTYEWMSMTHPPSIVKVLWGVSRFESLFIIYLFKSVISFITHVCVQFCVYCFSWFPLETSHQ